MPTSYTSLLGLALPVTGELSGVWGDTVNDYITTYLDGAVAGTQTISGSQTAVTLSKTTGTALTQAGSGATGSSQYMVINCTGNPASMLTITAPAASKIYFVINATSTNQDVKVVGTGPTTGVTMVSGERAIIAWNGSDFVKVASSTADGVTSISFGSTGLTPSTATSGAVTVAGTLATTNGGTGLTSFTANGLVYASSSSALTTGSALVFDGTNLGLGVTPSAWLTGSKALQVGATSSLWNIGGSGTQLSNNYLYTTGGVNQYLTTGYATTYVQNSSGQHAWYTAPSGTAGNAITFTQAMTLDANGNLGVGQTSMASDTRLHLNNTTNNTLVKIQSTFGAELQLINGGGSELSIINASGNNVLVFRTGGTERARITSGGQFAVSSAGTAGAPVISKSDDLDTGIFFPAANELAFAVNGVEELRITSAGFTRPVAYADTVSALGNTGTATTINLQNANVFTATLTGNCTFTLSNPIATGSSSFTLILTNDGTAGRSVAWAGGSFVFPGGAASLSRTTTANATDVWVFFTPNGGTTWYGNIAMKDMKA